MLMMLISFFYAAIIIICFLALQVFQFLPQKSSFDQVVKVLVVTFLLHITFMALFRSILEGYQYIDRGEPFGFLYGPILYVLYLTNIGKPIEIKKLWPHLLPFSLFLVAFICFIIFESFRMKYSNAYFFVLFLFLGFSWLTYPVVLLVQVFGAKHGPIQMKRIFYLSTVLLLILACLVIPIFIIEYNNGIAISNFISGVAINIIMLLGALLSYNYLLGELLIRNKKNESLQLLVNLPAAKHVKPDKKPVHRYEEDFQIYDQILTYLETRPYLTANFNLESMRKDLQLSKRTIIQFFKSQYQQNINRAINSLRIEAACEELESPSLDMNISDLALKCGFSSRASFYRNFTLEKNCSPFEYRETKLHSVYAKS